MLGDNSSAAVSTAQEIIQRCCATFLAALEVLRSKLPEDFFNIEKGNLFKLPLASNTCTLPASKSGFSSASSSVTISFCCAGFMTKCMDADLESLMGKTVPPVQIDQISQFRSVLFKFKRKAPEVCASYGLSCLQFT